ncbi:MAG: peptidoglycan D,D-transpeptidase FtsI family protein, partial [Gemmatimonadales bacterium]
MAKPVARIWLLEVVFLLAVVAIVGRAAQLQLLQGSRWARTAAETRTERVPIVARRGAIYDRSGTPLAVTQEFYHVGIAPREVTDRKALVRAAARALGLPQGRIDRGLRGSAYLYFHGPYTASEVDTLRSFRGVHLEVEYNRFYPSRELARPVIGSLAPDGGDGASGLESALNDLLTGTPGEQVVLKDRAGRRYESPGRIIRRPVPGYDVTLTIDAALQEIAEAGLEEAIASNDASGGDVVFYDSRTGEILALASRQRTAGGFSNRPTALTDPFEPGSTAKLFTAAALLSGGLVSDTDAEDAEDGRWLLSVSEREPPRLLEDSHISHGRLTLAQAVEVSSNIVMAKFSFRLTREQQYEMLRGFGFGSPTGVEYPSESRGRLQRPDGWTEYTRPSLAIGYEFSVTPLQLAAAYGAIAN